MKKSLVALATLAAVSGAALAQSSVTLSGIAKAGVSNAKYSNGASGNSTGTSVADGSSQFWLLMTEDLGGGLKAEFKVDTRFRFDDNGGAGAAPTAAIPSQLATGNTYLGLTGGFGTIRMGKMDTHYCLGSDTHSARATSLAASSCSILAYVGSSAAANTIANASRSTNVIRYMSPMFGGLQLQANYSTAWASTEGALGVAGPAAGSDGKGNAWNVRADYAAGPLSLGASYWNATGEDQRATVARSGQTGATLAANYNLGMATVGLTYDQSAIRAAAANAGFVDTKRTATSVPVTVPMGAGTFLLTYTKASNTKTAGVANANTGASMMSVGYDYALSKRTSVGISYAKINNSANAAYNLYVFPNLVGHGSVVAGQDPSQLYVGIRHAF